ncbi:MAG: DPP IV N-terminal domain-containing protein, partial [Gluconacetobacter diazotrophicus]|nr:DPP IV N-terminal domain-containing protein [Gluconacetobacter diazotrophicus]
RAMPTPDGRAVIFLRSGPRDTALHLYRYEIAGKALTELAKPDAAGEHLSVEEKARRERARMTLTGITDFALSRDGKVLLLSEGGRLGTMDPTPGADGTVRWLAGSDWIGPRLSPDGRFVAAVRNHDLHVVELATGRDAPVTSGGSDLLTHGVAEFAAAEELERPDGTWWSPDGETLLFEEADLSGEEQHFIADPEHPTVAPNAFRYPRAGTNNARVRLGLVGRNGGATRWVDWDGAAFPYLARVDWQKNGRLSLVGLNREQTAERVLAVDPATGHADTLLEEHDPAWIDVAPGGGTAGGLTLPHWLPDGSGFLWAAERNDRWQLELHRADGSLLRTLTTAATPYMALYDAHATGIADPDGDVVIAADPDREQKRLFRVRLRDGAATPLEHEPGLHEATFSAAASAAGGDAAAAGSDAGHAVFVDKQDGADGTRAVRVRNRDGTVLGTLPSVAEVLPLPHVEYLQAGPTALDALLIRPTHAEPNRRYPVVLSVYAGPTLKMVVKAPRRYQEEQCLADEGFVVASLDGRGTPGRGRNWERATKNDLIDAPLADQADGVRALAASHREMDGTRIGVEGWSFGGYFTAMATIRRPDVFAAGVAGAPVVDFADYDTAYTERYLGLPQADADGYRKSDVLSYAAGLSRPLLVMHGVTDDNVYFENSMKLTQALLAAGRPYDLLLLPGTHQLPNAA